MYISLVPLMYNMYRCAIYLGITLNRCMISLCSMSVVYIISQCMYKLSPVCQQTSLGSSQFHLGGLKVYRGRRKDLVLVNVRGRGQEWLVGWNKIGQSFMSKYRERQDLVFSLGGVRTAQGSLIVLNGSECFTGRV